MPSYLAALAALGAVALSLPAVRSTPDAAPMTAKYRVDQSLRQEVDASGAGAGKQTLAFTTSAFVTLTLADSAGGRTMRVVIDSIKGDSASPIPAEIMDSARGGEFRGFVERSGRPGQLRASGGPAAAMQVQGLLSDFFPWVRAGIKVGETWADTSVNTTGEGADTVTVRRITSYRAAGSENRERQRAIRIATGHTSQVRGSQPTPNGPAKIEGSGNGTGSYFVSPNGRYLGGEWKLRSTLTLSGNFAPQPLPITVDQTTTVALIR